MKLFNPQLPQTPVYRYVSHGIVYEVWLALGQYENGRVALMLEGAEGGRVAVATVNLADCDLPSGHVHVKTWSENQDMLAFLLANRIVEDTGIDVAAGFAAARLCRIGPNWPVAAAYSERGRREMDWRPMARSLMTTASEEFADKSDEFVLQIAADRLNQHFQTDRFDVSHIVEAL